MQAADGRILVEPSVHQALVVAVSQSVAAGDARFPPSQRGGAQGFALRGS